MRIRKAEQVHNRDMNQTPKEDVLRMIQDLPENSSYEDIEYHMYVLHKLRGGIAAAERGEVYSQEEVEQYFSKWLAE